MGLDDRDYMRDRYRERQGGKREVPLGSASWIGRAAQPAGSGGGWFEKKNRGQDYQRGRYRPRRSSPLRHARWLIPVLCLLTYVIPMYFDAKRGGWLPDLMPGIPFPESGSVTVPTHLSQKRITSSLTVQTSDANAVVQLFDPETDEHVLSVYVAGNDHVVIPAPRGTYRMKIVEGRKWHGPTRYFGPNTQYETVLKLMTFSQRMGNGIDLRRRVDGNLHTRPMITNPEPLL